MRNPGQRNAALHDIQALLGAHANFVGSCGVRCKLVRVLPALAGQRSRPHPRAVARERNVAQVQARLQAGVTRARASATTPRKYGRP